MGMDFIERDKYIQEELEDLFPLPEEDEGSGYYIDTIYDGLKKWYDSDAEEECCPQEFQVLWYIKRLLDRWQEREDREYNNKEEDND